MVTCILPLNHMAGDYPPSKGLGKAGMHSTHINAKFSMHILESDAFPEGTCI